MRKSKSFPERPLNKPLEMNSAANPEDVLDVKIFLHQKGLYDIPDYGMPPYPDEKLFTAIKSYQKKKGLKVDGVMKANGETQETMRKDTEIEREELKPPPGMEETTPDRNIPGTNIPDKGVPDGSGWPDPNGPNYDENANMDSNIIIGPRGDIILTTPELGQNLPSPPRYPRGGRY